jgi:hypothetical protein
VHQLAQRTGERRVGQALLAQLKAVTDEHLRALGDRGPAELLDQAGLADPRLAADQHGRRLGAAGPFQRVAQRCQVGLTADEDRTAGARRHDVEHATGVRRNLPPESVDHGIAGARTTCACRAARPNLRCRPAVEVACASR